MKNKGFTLAEVLITLGIIGVVAALTLPSLIANYKKQTYVTQLKKAYSTWNEGIKLMLATDGVDYINDTEFAKTVLDSGQTVFDGNATSSVPAAVGILRKYIKIINTEDSSTGRTFKNLGNSSTYTTGSNYEKLYLADGAVCYVRISYLDRTTNDNFNNGSMFIDINGEKGPNIRGRDVFYFYIDKTGLLIPCNAEQTKELWNYTYWKDNPQLCGTEGSSQIASDVTGEGCAARIMENGWVMDY